MTPSENTTGQSSAGWHRLESFIICPRKFAYRYIGNLVPRVTPKPLALGTCVHDALAAFYRGEDWERVLQDAPIRWAYTVPLARPMIASYVKKHLSERLNLLSVEKEYRCRLGGELLTRRLDLVLEQQGKIWIYDHKTSSYMEKRMAGIKYEGALFSQVILGASILPKIYGIPWGGLILNLLGTNPPYDSDRKVVFYRPEVLRSYIPSLIYHLKALQSFSDAGTDMWDYPLSWQCQGRYSVCEYLDLCPNDRSGVVNYEIETP